MGQAQDIRELRDSVEELVKRQRYKEALEALDKLELYEPESSRWPHRRGDVHRKLGETRAAVSAYERATNLYAQQGFIARAVAMAKTILVLDSSRTDVLERVDPSAAQSLHRAQRQPLPPVSPIASTPPPAPPTAAKLPKPVARVALAKIKTPPPEIIELPVLDAVEFDSEPVRLRVPVVSRPSEHPVAMGLVAGTPKFATRPVITDPPALPEDAFLSEEPSLRIDIDIDFSELEVSSRSELPASRDAEPSAERLAMLPIFSLFAELPREALLELSKGSELVELPDEATVVRFGEPADALYAITSGSVQVRVPGLPESNLVFLSEGEVFGESCLLEGETRRADVVVHGELTALKIPARMLAELGFAFPRVSELLFELLTRRLVGNLMQTSTLFNVFDPPTRRELACMFEVRRAARDTVLLKAGNRSDGLYIPLTGRLRVEPKGGTPTLAGAGTVFGQESLISSSPSPVTVTSMVDMALLRLPAGSFLGVAAQFPPVLEHLAELASATSGAGLGVGSERLR